MPRAPVPDAPVLSTRALNRATLARQSLIERSPMAPKAMVEHLVGMQAPLPPYFGLWSRLESFQPDVLSHLVIDRTVVRIVVMRGTVHLVTAADACVLRPLVQPIMDRDLRTNMTYSRALHGIDFADLATAGRELLEERPRTMVELRPLLSARWPDHDPASLAHGVRDLLPLVQVPPRGVWGRSGQPSCTTLEAWTGKSLDGEPSIDEVILRYLAAFGPASVRDAQVWSGLTRLSEVFNRLRPQLMTFANEDGIELFDVPDAPRPEADMPVPVRILAPFDNVLISYADRRRVLSELYRKLIFTHNGLVKSTVLVDGFVVGYSAITRIRKLATLTIELFEPIPVRDREEIAAEGQRLIAFADPSAGSYEIAFTGVT